ncbi:type VII secretion protein EssB [Peribacillus loiseleuriae]|uniref:type VII secretion protein EssB n=1 Tax=Peribacillus loiseleuriae TaxID=1679170 RepID=UPI003CFBFFC6
MTEQSRTYLEEQLEAVLKREENSIHLIFQREKIKLNDRAEIEMIKDIDPSIHKEVILSEDELSLVFQPPQTYLSFKEIQSKDEKSRWFFAFQLIKKIMNHPFHRMHLIVCPENIVMDASLTPYFLHYGVMESIPPYERDRERLWREIKAVVAASVVSKHPFLQYLKYHETLELSPNEAEIMNAENEEALLAIIQKNMKLLDLQEKNFVRVTKKEWKITRFVSLGLLTFLLPALIYSLYSLIFSHPKQAAFINSQEYFLNKEYSQVINTLSDYKIKGMPQIVQYELAQSFIIHEALNEDQKEVIRNTVSLQADPQYYQYWIHIGRGEAKGALEIARSLEDRDIIILALFKYQEELKADDTMKSEEKQQELDKIETELNEYKQEQKALEEEAKRLEEEEKRNKEKQEEQAKLEAEQQQALEQASKAQAPQNQSTESQKPAESKNN